MSSMTLIKSQFNGNPSFRMIPIIPECPYNEVIFDPATKILAVVSKEKKKSFKMTPKLDENGDRLYKSGVVPIEIQEERLSIDTYYEYHLSDPSDIDRMVRQFALNKDEFDYKKYLYASTLKVAANS